MSIYDRFMNSNFLSRRRLITGGSAGLLAAAASGPGRAGTESTTPPEGSIEDQLAIQDLLYRYGIALDSLDKESFGACWDPATLTPKLLDQAIEYHRQYAHTMHKMLNHTYKVRGRRATGVTYCVASMVKSDAEGQLSKFDIYIMYRDELTKPAERWIISRRELEIIFSSPAEPVTPGAPLLGLPSLNKPGSLRERPALQNL